MAIRYYVSTEEASFFNNNRMGYANSIPTEGNYKVGDFIISSTQEDGVFGWVCTVAGNPGEWEVIGSGATGADKVVCYINAVSFSNNRNSIEIGINGYRKGKDFLEVHYNGLLLAEGVHYNISADGKSIVAIDGDWNENADDTQQMIFKVLKSTVSVIEPTDGSVTMNKLSNDIKEDLAAIDGLVASVGTQNTTISNINGRVSALEADGSVTMNKLSNDIKEDLAAIDGLVASVGTQNTTISNINDRVSVLESAEEIDLSGYQGKNDGNLATSNKTIVGAINELFQSANNGKQLIASAIGEPLSATDTFTAMRNEIEEMLEYFRDKLRSVGVTDSLDNLKLKELIDKVNIQYYSFSITKKLTNCTINNDTTIINRNSSYSASITVDPNGVMKSIKVTMGGVDITSTAVTGNDINITSVTGDIVITANAVVNPYEPGTNVNNAGSSINAYQYNPKTLTIPVEADGTYTLSFSYGPNISNQGYTASVTVGIYGADGGKIDNYSESTKTSGSFSKNLSLKKGSSISITASISTTTHSSHCNQVTGIKLVFKSL